jgi:hypothetical protein
MAAPTPAADAAAMVMMVAVMTRMPAPVATAVSAAPASAAAPPALASARDLNSFVGLRDSFRFRRQRVGTRNEIVRSSASQSRCFARHRGHGGGAHQAGKKSSSVHGETHAVKNVTAGIGVGSLTSP